MYTQISDFLDVLINLNVQICKGDYGDQYPCRSSVISSAMEYQSQTRSKLICLDSMSIDSTPQDFEGNLTDINFNRSLL